MMYCDILEYRHSYQYSKNVVETMLSFVMTLFPRRRQLGILLVSCCAFNSLNLLQTRVVGSRMLDRNGMHKPAKLVCAHTHAMWLHATFSSM